MQIVNENDWILFRSKIGSWQEKYMEKLCGEYVELLSSGAAASERFWTLEKRIKSDRISPGVIIEMRRSALFENLVSLFNNGVICDDDLEGFSDEIRKTVKEFVR